jgi:hypothetical protein
MANMAISDNHIQSSYAENISPPTAGTIAACDFKTRTGTVETASIAFGVAVSQGSADKSVVKGGAAADFLGISVRDVTCGAEQDHYAVGQNMGYISEGQVWVVTGGAVSAGDAVHFDATSGAISGASGHTITNARFVTSGASGERVLVELGAAAAS